MNLVEAGFLLDVNLLIALVLLDHPHHDAATRWFDRDGFLHWGTCALTQAGFIRIMASPKVRGLSVTNADKLLAMLTAHPGHRIWPITEGWTATTSPFMDRICGHRQVTDAYLLGLAVEQNGVLVTMDRAIRHLAGPRYKKNLIVLEP